jgi:hypothetical protein
MASPKSQSVHKSKKRGAVRRDFWRTLLVIACLGGAGAVALVMGATTTVVSKAEIGPEQKMRTASVLFIPLFGDACRQSIFDNRNGMMSQENTMSCEKLAKKMRKDEKNQSAGFEKMSDSFRK